MTDEQCQMVVGDHVDEDDFRLYDSKGFGKTIAVCSVHRDPENPFWNMRWPCPHAQLAWTRSRNGKTIHLSGCGFEKVSWSWATGKSLIGLYAVAKSHGYRFCKRCVPTADSVELIIEEDSDPPRNDG